MNYPNLFLLFVILISNNLSGNNFISENLVVDNNEIFVSVETEDDSNYFLELNYNSSESSIDFKTSEKVEVIHVINNIGEVMYHLPIDSKNISIRKSLLEKGEFTLLFFNKNGVEKKSKVIIK